MTTYFDEPYANVWVDATIPCVYTTIKRPLRQNEFELVAKAQLSCLIQTSRSKAEVFSVTDFTDCKGMSRQDAVDYMSKVVEREFRLGLSRKFFIRSHDKTSRDALIHGLVACASLNFYVFDSFSEVMREINTIRESEQSMTGKKSRASTFLIPRVIRNFFALRFEVKM